MHSRTIDRPLCPPLTGRAALLAWLIANLCFWSVIVVGWELLHGI